MEIHIFELPKIKEHEYPETELLNWMRFMNAEKKEEFEMLAEKDKYIEKAYEKLTELSADEVKRLEYEEREKAIRDHNYLMKSNLEIGFKKGIEEGVRSIIKLCKEFSLSKEETVIQLIEKLSLDEETAREYVKQMWE